MKFQFANIQPVLAPVYIYVLLVTLLPVAAVIDLFVAPSIHWETVSKIPLMASIYVGYLLFLGLKTGPFDTAPRWSKAMRLAAECMLLYTLTSTCLPLLDQMVKINTWPLADPWLAAADDILGFDWFAYFNFVHDRPWLISVFYGAYMWTGELSFLLVVVLILLGQLRRIRYYMEVVVLTTFACILMSAVTPAYAAAIYYGLNFANYPNFGFAPGIYHIESLVALREASPDYRVGEQPFKGLVTFPSVHTALGVLMAGAVWRHWLFWPCALYAVVMIASTPVFGSHYIIDVIAGVAVSVAVMALIAKRKTYSGLFSPKTTTGDIAVPAG